MNSMFELATIDEIDKLRTAEDGGSSGKSSDDLQLDDLEVNPVTLIDDQLIKKDANSLRNSIITLILLKNKFFRGHHKKGLKKDK